mmetsp:Transcript_50241/g.151240  ORF Transcript_50241/g.151240 Transcript_50241/m.151240 type:complete len:302 (-) Transcript_50241:429-1334(-)
MEYGYDTAFPRAPMDLSSCSRDGTASSPVLSSNRRGGPVAAQWRHRIPTCPSPMGYFRSNRAWATSTGVETNTSTLDRTAQSASLSQFRSSSMAKRTGGRQADSPGDRDGWTGEVGRPDRARARASSDTPLPPVTDRGLGVVVALSVALTVGGRVSAPASDAAVRRRFWGEPSDSKSPSTSAMLWSSAAISPPAAAPRLLLSRRGAMGVAKTPCIMSAATPSAPTLRSMSSSLRGPGGVRWGAPAAEGAGEAATSAVSVVDGGPSSSGLIAPSSSFLTSAEDSPLMTSSLILASSFCFVGS